MLSDKKCIICANFTVSLQQGLRCNFCEDCDRATGWTQRDCSDDSPPGTPTNPPPIFPTNANENQTSPFVDSNWQSWQCFTVVYESGGRRTSRGCVARRATDDDTCNSIRANPILCNLCDDRNHCNKSSGVFISMSVIVVGLLLALKM